MLFDPRNEQGKQGFKPNVDNTIKPAKATGGQKFAIVLFFILTLGIFAFFWIARKNKYRRMQSYIIEASSNIEVSERKRHATLIKLVDVVKGYAVHERKTFENITKYRSQLAELTSEKDPQKLSSTLNKIQGGINVQLENYPQLKADRLYLQISSEVSFLEDEINAAIRLYNQKVRAFNQEIYNFWTVWVCEKLEIHNMPYYEASEEERTDVNLSGLTF